MPTQRYEVEDGERVPSVTGILARFKDCGPLMYWSWKEGMEGRDFRQTRDKAADVGTCAHDMVECFIRQKEFDPSKYEPDAVEAAKKAFGAFEKWAGQVNLKPAYTETALVSEKHRYGGTLDTMFVGGELAIGDWKASKGVYPEYYIQVAGGYKILWEENHPDMPITGGYHICRFSPQYGDFEHRYFTDSVVAERAFLRMRALYDDLKELKDRIR